MNLSPQRRAVVHPVPLAPHHVHEDVEGGLVVVEHQHVLARGHQFVHHQALAAPVMRCQN